MHTEISVDYLLPNPWNFNELSDKNFSGLVDELRSTKRNDKAIVVVKLDDEKYEIIDGEWTWRAAREAELQFVSCEVVEADPFERRRRTWTRNRHGIDNPLREGRMFVEMLKLKEEEGEPISVRELARRMPPLTEQYIRRKLLYVELSEKAKDDPCLPNDLQIGKLSIRKVMEFLGMVPSKEAPSGPDIGEKVESAGEGGPPGEAEMADLKARFAAWPEDIRQQFLSWAEAQSPEKAPAAGG